MDKDKTPERGAKPAWNKLFSLWARQAAPLCSSPGHVTIDAGVYSFRKADPSTAPYLPLRVSVKMKMGDAFQTASQGLTMPREVGVATVHITMRSESSVDTATVEFFGNGKSLAIMTVGLT